MGTFEDVWLIKKHCKAWDFGGWVKGWAVQKKSGLIFMIYMYMLYDVFLRKQLLFFWGGGRGNCTCIKIFSGVNFFNHN